MSLADNFLLNFTSAIITIYGVELKMLLVPEKTSFTYLSLIIEFSVKGLNN